MRRDLLPLFPLPLVLLPGTPLPLHIFEDRYKEMMGEILATDAEFGVVQARDQGILRVGCTATVAEVLQRYEDGRIDVMTTGLRRFQIEAVDSERSFLRCEATFIEDNELDIDADPEDRRRAAEAYVTLQEVSGETVQLPDLTTRAISFVLGNASTDLDFRQTLLSIRSEAERLRLVANHLEQFVEKRKLETAVRKVAGQNGHSRHHPNLS